MKLDTSYFEDVLEGSLSLHTKFLVAQHNWNYHPCGEHHAEGVVAHIERVIAAREFSVAYDRNKWEKGWGESLREFLDKGTDSLVPQYLSRGIVNDTHAVRLRGQYVNPETPYFELHWYQVLRQHLIDTYLADVANVYEFGSGTGWNLLAIAQERPNVNCFGLDWSSPAVTIANVLNDRTGLPIFGRRFDFFEPDETLLIFPESAVLTVGALEQTGNSWRPFVDYVLGQKPKRCVHIEPMDEFYINTPFDQLALRYHQARGYWTGFLAHLRYLEGIGRARIITARRLQFGNVFHEGYSLVVWEPL